MDRFSDGLQGQGGPEGAGLLGLAFAQDYDSSTESSGGPKIGDVREFWLCKIFTGKTGQNEITKFHQKLEFLMIF